MERKIELPRQTRAAEVRASSFSEPDNTVELVWTTGARVRRVSWMDGPYDEELVVSQNAVRLERLNAGAPFLDTHDDYSLRSVIGAVVPGSAKIERGVGVATIKLSSAPGDADTVRKIRDGIIRNVSVGYRILKVEKTEGQDGDVALWRVVDWEPMELSAVPIPADPGAQMRSAEGRRANEPVFTCIVAGSDTQSAEATRARMRMRARGAGLTSV